jgi:mono/diheme cytochrome c family protein
MRVAVMALCFLLLSVSTADACGRCGLFGRRCAFAQKQVVVKPSYGYAYQQPSNTTNLSLINVYPQGTAQYSVAQLAQSYQVNPSLSLELSSRIAGQALDNQAASIRLAQEHSQTSAELQRQALALQLVQSAMGNSQVSASASSSLSLEVNQGSGARTDAGGAAQGSAVATGSLLAQKCAKCHGLDKQAPKAGLYYDQGHWLDASASVAALRVIAGHDVPEQMSSVIQSLTDEERCQLLLEVASLSRR